MSAVGRKTASSGKTKTLLGDDPAAGVDYRLIVDGASPPADLGKGRVDPQRGPVRAMGGHRLHHVRDGKDAGFHPDLAAAKPSGVPAAVKPLVVLPDDVRQGPAERHRLHDVAADGRVGPDEHHFRLGEPAR